MIAAAAVPALLALAGTIYTLRLQQRQAGTTADATNTAGLAAISANTTEAVLGAWKDMVLTDRAQMGQLVTRLEGAEQRLLLCETARAEGAAERILLRGQVDALQAVITNNAAETIKTAAQTAADTLKTTAETVAKNLETNGT